MTTFMSGVVQPLSPTGPNTFIQAPVKGTDISLVADNGDGTLLVQIGGAKLTSDLRSQTSPS